MTWGASIWYRAALYIGLAVAGLSVCGVVSAEVEDETGYITITEENDSLASPFGEHQDRHYTQGLKIALFAGDDFLPDVTNFFNHFPVVGMRPEATHFGMILLGQNIYTPSNLLTRTQIKNDRPYAGWLYTGFIFQRRGDLTATLSAMENFEINIGVVGPDSLAAQSQETVHRWWFSDDIPKGWKYQLRNEPGGELKYLRTYRYSPTVETARFIDFLGRIGGEVGNVADEATAGATIRVGYNLPRDYGVAINDSPGSNNGGYSYHTPWFFIYVFGGVDGRAVGHDITLDGNTGRGGPSVTKNVLVGDLSWGFAIQFLHHIEVAYTHTIRTEEFRGQEGDDAFGSLTAKGTFAF